MVADSDDNFFRRPALGIRDLRGQPARHEQSRPHCRISVLFFGNGIYFFTGTSSTARNVMRIGGIAPGSNASFNNIQQIAIDDNDRVAFAAT